MRGTVGHTSPRRTHRRATMREWSRRTRRRTTGTPRARFGLTWRRPMRSKRTRPSRAPATRRRASHPLPRTTRFPKPTSPRRTTTRPARASTKRRERCRRRAQGAGRRIAAAVLPSTTRVLVLGMTRDSDLTWAGRRCHARRRELQGRSSGSRGTASAVTRAPVIGWSKAIRQECSIGRENASPSRAR